MNTNPEYITDNTGKKKAVIIPIEDYEEMMQDIEDLAVVAERKNEPSVSHQEVIARLKKDGLLSN